MESICRVRPVVDCGEMAGGDVREEIVVPNAFGRKLGSHGSKAILLSHVWGGTIAVASRHVPAPAAD